MGANTSVVNLQRLQPANLQGDNVANNTLPPAILEVTDAMPVTLASFNVNKEGSSGSLTWVTTEEVNSDRFEVQHSSNAQNWVVLGTVASHKDSKLRNEYRYTHVTPVNGVNYYRLKMIDRDATFEYSPIKSIELEGTRSELTNVYPNPVRPGESLTIETVAGGLVKQIELISSNGIKVYESSAPKQAINRVPTDSYPAGLYLVRVLYVDGTSSVRKIVLAR